MRRSAGTLVPFPAWEGNPYLGMLSLAAEAAGWRIAGHKGVAGLIAEMPHLASGDVLHVHWTSPVTGGAQSPAAAELRRQEFREVMVQMKARGVTLLWTVHNEISHDARYPEVERGIAADLASLSDAIIQLHDHTAEFVRTSVVLPSEKLVTIPHASYIGVYEDGRDRSVARALVGVDADVPTVGFVGQIRPYKGVDALFRAADYAAETVPDLTLLVAGKLSPRDALDFVAAQPRRARTIVYREFIEPADLWTWFRASDVIALPYRKVLNSGSVPLAATFDRRCIVPDDTAIAREYAAEPWVSSFRTDHDPDRALANAIIEVLERRPVDSVEAAGFARRNTPYEMSRAYLALLERTLNSRMEAVS